MAQTDIPTPKIASGRGYSFLYSLYLHCAAFFLRRAVAYFTGSGSLFTKHGFIETPGLGDGRVGYSANIPEKTDDSQNSLPLVLVIEGGGFILGQPSDGERNDCLLSENLNAVVLSIDYAKSPKYPFPHALLQLFEVLKWSTSADAARELDTVIDPSRVAIMGNSAGGNLTAALSLLTAFTQGPCARFRMQLPETYRQVAQVLLYPSVACNQLYRERYANASPEARAESLPVPVAELMEASYLPPSVEKAQIFVAPLLASVQLLEELRSNIAPVACYVAGLDCLKGEAVQYCRKLQDAGMQVVVQEYPKAFHGFSHYSEGSPKFRKQDVEDCWGSITQFLNAAFSVAGSNSDK